MTYTLQLHGEKYVHPLPEGLSELMTDISRETLRAQPKNTVDFIADYLTALQVTRAAAKNAISIVDQALEDDLMKYCVTLKCPPNKILWATLVIQRGLKRYFEKKNISKKKPTFDYHKVARKIKFSTKIDENLGAHASFLQAHKITFLQAHYAALIIQKAWRGHKVRKRFRFKKSLRTADTTDDPYKGAFELDLYSPNWANSWMTLFDKNVPLTSPFLKGSVYPIKNHENSYLPRREISVYPKALETIFRGKHMPGAGSDQASQNAKEASNKSGLTLPAEQASESTMKFTQMSSQNFISLNNMPITEDGGKKDESTTSAAPNVSYTSEYETDAPRNGPLPPLADVTITPHEGDGITETGFNFENESFEPITQEFDEELDRTGQGFELSEEEFEALDSETNEN